MSRHQLSIIIILGLFVGILGCYVESGSMPLAKTVFTTPNNIIVRPEPTSVSFFNNYRQGLEAAKRDTKLVLVFFTLPNSDVSQHMMETTFCDEEIKRLANNRFVCIQIDGSKDAEFCKSIDIKGFPTVLFMNSQGEELQRFAGKLSPDQLAIQMHVMIQTTAIKTGNIVRK